LARILIVEGGITDAAIIAAALLHDTIEAPRQRQPN
jgi:hypothetical protein